MNSYNAENYIIKKLKNNKDTIILEFNLVNDFTKYTNMPIYNVALQIYKKRRRYCLFEEHIHSGSGDITSLLLAKEMLVEFEEDYLAGKIIKYFDSINLEILGLDKRRFNVYKRYLVPLGYNLNTSSGISFLYKDIKRNKNLIVFENTRV